MQILAVYLIILIFQSAGIAAKILVHIGNIRKENPTMTPKQVWAIIKEKDWDVLLWSGVILFLDLAVQGVMDIFKVQREGWYGAWWFDIARGLTLGFAGQDVLTRALGTAKQKALNIAGGGTTVTTVIQETADSIKEKTTTETIKLKDE